MILFFGTRIRRRVLGTGAFRCPYCLEPRGYELAESRAWFHIFWIPLIPIGTSREGVRCTACGGEWAPRVLEGNQPG